MTDGSSPAPSNKKQVLMMEAPGANPEGVIAGIVAAKAIFDAHGTSATEAAIAAFKREAADVNGCFLPVEQLDQGIVPPPQIATEREMEIADVWYMAGQAALATCYGNHAIPGDAQLVLRTVSSPGSR